MGELNTAPMRINKVEGAADQVKVSGGPGVLESWGSSVVKVRKTANQDIVNNIVVQNDNHLFLGVGATDVWAIFAYIRYIGESINPDWRCAWTVPAGGSFSGARCGDIGALVAVTHAVPVANLTVEYTDDAIVTEKLVLIWGLYIGGGTAGTLQFKFAQKNVHADYIRVMANSHIIAIKLS